MVARKAIAKIDAFLFVYLLCQFPIHRLQIARCDQVHFHEGRQTFTSFRKQSKQFWPAGHESNLTSPYFGG